MGSLGMEQFIRQFYGQMDKQALLVDERWNGGGFIDQILLERLRRVLVGLSVERERAPATIPQQLIAGRRCGLLNHYSGSDGDIFPFYFRKYGLGPLIGTRSWAGVRGHPGRVVAARRRLHYDSRGRDLRARLAVGAGESGCRA